ncbi:hypothetical protein DEU56DRAFT_787029 [Suillus clintonianus]|uniref:uncharacterized protein n=1 Tax=Suillus clintonianus TaxID=1904413 RepID=UPI001B882F8C|nr:uncharacterized protein DEU56DRAFT_787029 [Suillus clintonianus]KAG2146244.1 hypothetical protein DEU56DRAFT_787029 [Suillus clintonianus]
MNVQGTPLATSQSSFSTGHPTATQSTGVPAAGSGASSGVGSSPSDAAPTLTTGDATSSHQLSSGAVGGIVVVCLLFLIGLIVLLVRRRFVARRLERRQQWWFGRNAASSSFSIVGSSMRESQSGGAPVLNRTSARSSFATNFDQGLMFRVDSPTSSPNVDLAALGTIPELPPMAEVRERTSLLFPSAGAVARRESMNSMMSNGSDPDTQYLIVTNDLNPLGQYSPMSVRPFSPSESFAFPKPPPCPNEGQGNSSASVVSGHGLVSPLSSAATLIQIHSPPPIFNSDLSPSAPGASYSQPPTGASLTAVPDTSSDPFADPASPEFEIIRRPFTPTLDDELSVAPGDKVLVIKVFDDGWAFVEKPNGSLGYDEKGLIPVDCLREAGQALPAFLAQKRVSSYGADTNQLAQMLAGSSHPA